MSAEQPSVRTIFIIRHGEKPEQKDGYGVDEECKLNKRSLVPRGWQRAGALARLFVPLGDPRPGLQTPTELIAPDYGTPADNLEHRTYQTIRPLSQLLGREIETPLPEGKEHDLGKNVADETTGVTLICWEHTAIHKIANRIPTPAGTTIPQSWPDPRFDVVWSFTFDATSSTYTFAQIPQLLLAGDLDGPILPAPKSG